MKITTTELIASSLKATMDDPTGPDKLKEMVRWLSDEMGRREIPIHICISAFAVLTEGARMVGEIATAGDEGEKNAIH